MPRARSMMHQHALDISGFPEEKPLDLADTYSSDYDDEPTVKIQVPAVLPLVDLNDVEDDEDTLIRPAPVVVTKYPGMGLAMALLFGVALWSLPLYYIATRLIK